MSRNINVILFILCISSTLLVLPDSTIKHLEAELFARDEHDNYVFFMSVTSVTAVLANIITFTLLNHFLPLSQYGKYQANSLFSFCSIALKIRYLNPYAEKKHSTLYFIIMKTLQGIDSTVLMPITLTYMVINESPNKEQLLSRTYGFIFMVGFVSPALINVFLKLDVLREYDVLYLLLVLQLLQTLLINFYFPRNTIDSEDESFEAPSSNKKRNYPYSSLTIATVAMLKISQLATFGFVPVLISIDLMKSTPSLTNVNLNFLYSMHSLVSLLSYFFVAKYIKRMAAFIANKTTWFQNRRMHIDIDKQKDQNDQSVQHDHILLFVANTVNLLLNILVSVTINYNQSYIAAALWAYMFIKSVFQANDNILILIIINHLSNCFAGPKLKQMQNNFFSVFSILEITVTSLLTYTGFRLYKFFDSAFYFLYLGLFLAILCFSTNLFVLRNIAKNDYTYQKQEITSESLLFDITETP